MNSRHQSNVVNSRDSTRGFFGPVVVSLVSLFLIDAASSATLEAPKNPLRDLSPDLIQVLPEPQVLLGNESFLGGLSPGHLAVAPHSDAYPLPSWRFPSSLVWSLSLKRTVVARTTELRTQVENRKRIERDYRETRENFENLVANLPGVVFRSQPEEDTPLEYVSESFEELTGYEPDSFLGNARSVFLRPSSPRRPGRPRIGA